jgi:HEAT repeat protein
MLLGIIFQIIFFLFSREFTFRWIELLDFINRQTITIKIIWILTACFFALFFLFFFILIFSRVVKNIQKRRREKIKNALATPFSIYLFDETIQEALSQNNHTVVIELFGKKYAKNSFSRYVLRKELIRLHHSYSGDISYKLEQLFTILGFDKEVGKKIKSESWNIKANAINDAAQMNLVEYSKRILNSVNHPNSIVRTEARVASVRLNRKNPFFFFNSLRFNMSDWDQIRIHDALMQYNNAEVPLMGKWLNSSNESVVIFSLKIIGYYSQEEEIEKVVNCLNNPSENVKRQALKTLGKLGSKQSLSVLFDCLKNEKGNKKLILQALQSLRLIGIFDNDLGKLKEFLYTKDQDIILSACLAIRSAPNGIQILNKSIPDYNESVMNIIKYALSYKD